ncbi:MAG: SusC/RagA family TonB-linked outer membrane protein, partial [Candidatus Nephrothrix sp. EaCA]
QGALQRKITLSVDNEKVKQVLNKIEATGSVRFVYQPQVVNTARAVSLAVEEMPIGHVLNMLFDGGAAYEEMGDLVVIKPMSRNVAVLVSVSGKITDAKTSEPLPGVNVTVKGTAHGTSADAEGKYALTVDDPNATLVFSYVGYISQEVLIGAQSVIDIQLEADEKQLDEVVVVGYGTQKKVNLTGAVASISAEAINRRPVTNPVAMLQGQVPGLQIVQGTGQPGNEGLSVQIRGQGTYSGAGSSPLVLIDGAPGSLNNLNPADIETVSVLKDAASAAIYGARAANGVILVTTKTGKADSFHIEFNTNVAVHTPSRMLKLVTNSADYMRLFNEARQNSGTASAANTYTADMIKLYETATDRVRYPNFDWIDYMFNPATVSISSLSLNGGAKSTTYNMSLGYTKQPGTLRGFDYEKFNFRSNIKSDIKKWATVGSNISLERGNRNETLLGGTDTFLSTLAQAPTYGPILPNGRDFTYSAYSFEYHNKNYPAITANNGLPNTINYDAFMQLWTELRLFKGFSWYTKGTLNLETANLKTWSPTVKLYNYLTGDLATTSAGTGLSAEKNNNFYSNFYSYMMYEAALNHEHEFSFQAGYSQEYNRYEFLKGARNIYATTNLYELNAGSASVQDTGGSSSEWAIQSFFGRFKYNYKDRYLFEANTRIDGTSRISKNSRWGAFPSFSAAWRVSQEDFFKNASIGWVSEFKIRASYGRLGNQNIGTYPYQGLLSFTGAYPFDNSSLQLGAAQTDYANQNIKWETTTITNVGLDFQLLKGLSFVYDYYVRSTSDILRGAQVTASLGLGAPTVNSGNMENRGHEISLKYNREVRTGRWSGLSYNGNIFFDFFKNKLTKFGAKEIDRTNIRENGLPYNSFYMLDWIGVFQTQEEINNSPKQFNYAVVPGDLKYRDVNGDNVVNDEDRVVIPGRFPKFNYAFNAGVSYKGFDLSLFFQGVQGRKVYVNGWGYETFRQGAAPTLDWQENRWTGPGTSNTLPRIYFDYENNQKNRVGNSWFLQDASYLRLKNINFGYAIPQKLVRRIKAERLRIYFSADNLLTFTKYKYLDPERGGDGAFVAYPQNKVVSLGLNLTY